MNSIKKEDTRIINKIIGGNKKSLFKKQCSKGDLKGAKFIHETYGISFDNNIDYDFMPDLFLPKLFCSSKYNPRDDDMLNVIEWLLEKIKQSNISIGLIKTTYVHTFRKACKAGMIKTAKYLWESVSQIKDLFEKNIETNEGIKDYDNMDWNDLVKHIWDDDEYEIEKYKKDLSLLPKTFKTACKHGKTEIAKWIYQLASDFNIPIDIYKNFDFYGEDRNLFKYACLNGDLETAKYLYQLALELNKPIDLYQDDDEIFKSVCYEAFHTMDGGLRIHPPHVEVARWIVSLDNQNKYHIKKDGEFSLDDNKNWDIK